MTELNPQVIEAIDTTNEDVVGVARGQSLALAYMSLANALQLMMLNSSQNQFGSQKVSVAANAAACAKIIAAGG